MPDQKPNGPSATSTNLSMSTKRFVPPTSHDWSRRMISSLDNGESRLSASRNSHPTSHLSSETLYITCEQRLTTSWSQLLASTGSPCLSVKHGTTYRRPNITER